MMLKEHTRFYQPAPITEGSHVEESGEKEESDTLAMEEGIERRRIQPEDAKEEDVVDVTTLDTPPSLPSSPRSSSHASFPK